MMRISLDSPALTAVRSLLVGVAGQPTPRAGRSGRRKASRTRFSAERLEPRMMLDGTSKTVMVAALPDLADASDTGASAADNVTYDQTPLLTGSVRGGATQVRLFINGQRGDLLPVTNATWTYELPATEALGAGRHTFAVRPVDASGRVGRLSRPLNVTVVTAAPAAPTIGLGAQSDSGVKGDGQTTFATPMLRGVAQPNRFVNISIHDVPVGRVRSDAKTGVWLLKSPQLANGVHDVRAVVENLAGLESAATSFSLTVNGERTVMLDATGGRTIELTASHLLGQGSQGFTVTQVLRGTLQKWVAAKNAWVTIPAAAYGGRLRNAPPNRTISFTDVVRWTPYSGAEGLVAAFEVIPLDKPGGPIATNPQAGTVPGNVVDPRIDRTEGARNSVAWSAPINGCGCPGTRYSIEVAHEDGRTRVYNVHSAVQEMSTAEGGAVKSAKFWAANETGAGEAVSLASTVIPQKKVTIVIRHGNDVQLEEKPWDPVSKWSKWDDPDRIKIQTNFQGKESEADALGDGPDRYTKFQEKYPNWNPRTTNYPAPGGTTFISSIQANYLGKNVTGKPLGLGLTPYTSLSDNGWKKAVGYATVLPELVRDLALAPISRVMADSYWWPNGGNGTSNPIDTVLPFIDANINSIKIDLVVKQNPTDSDEKAWKTDEVTSRLMPMPGHEGSVPEGSVLIVSTVQGLWNKDKTGGLAKGFILDTLIKHYNITDKNILNGGITLNVGEFKTGTTYRPEKGATIYVFGDLNTAVVGNELYIYHQFHDENSNTYSYKAGYGKPGHDI